MGDLGSMKLPDSSPPDSCHATLLSGQPCRFKSKHEHPEHGPLCGLHSRVLSRRQECAICMDVLKSRQRRKSLQCGHTFHCRCIKKWFGRGSLTCPMCRTVCLDELSSSHALPSMRIRHLLRVVPLPSGVFFPAYMLGLLNAPSVLNALNLGVDELQLVVELVYQSFTQEHFFAYMRQLNL